MDVNIRGAFAVLFSLLSFFCSRVSLAGEPFAEPLERIQVLRAEHVVSLRVIGLEPGVAGKVELELRTRAGVRLYAKKTRAEYDDGSGFPPPVTLTADPPARREFDTWYQEEREFFSGGTIFELRGPAFEKGRELRFHFEACNVKMCLLPTTYALTLREGAEGASMETVEPASTTAAPPLAAVTPAEVPATRLAAAAPTRAPEWAVSAAPALSPEASPSAQPVATQTPERASRAPVSAKPSGGLAAANAFLTEKIRDGGWLLLPFLFLAGLLMNLTPCVYPMIPITLSVLGRSAGRGRPWIAAGVYVVGMALVYALMGLLVALTGGLFGSLLQSPWVNGGVALVMVALGFAMLGFLDLSRVQALASRVPTFDHVPLLGTAIMGALSGVVSAPCTGPVLATLLLLVSQTGDALAGFIFLFVFALGFGAPYFFLGLFSARLRRMPRIGVLGDMVKCIFAALMFGLALYFARQFVAPWLPWLYQRPSAMVWGVLGAWAGFFLLLEGVGRRRFRPSLTHLVRFGTVVALSALSLCLTLLVLKVYVEQTSISWMKDWSEARARVAATSKPVLVDLWADWCAACKEMDAELWNDEAVAKIVAERFVAVKVDFTNESALSRQLIRVWNLGGLPAVGFYASGESLDGPPRILFREKVTREMFLEAVSTLGRGR